jgi:drug/metabolite transporter (DMT)-like permease
MTAFASLPAPVRGAMWMLGQTASFSIMIAAVRTLSPNYSVFEIAFFRAAIGLAFQLPWAINAGKAAFQADNQRILWLRSLFNYAGVVVWFLALSLMPMTDAIALQFTLPLFCVLGGVLFLREQVGLHRWAATAIGFAGALVIIRPGFEGIGPEALVALAASALYAGVHLTTRTIANTHVGVLAFHMNLIALPLTLIPAISGWVTPAWADIPWILALGIFGTTAHFFMGRAYRLAPASVIAPLDFSKLIFTALLGWFLFQEVSHGYIWLGGAIIVASTTYILRREARAARRAAE